MKALSWLTLLSLDAPLVALTWQEFIATEFGFDLNWHHRVIIALSVWLGYSADRWFDGWRYKSTLSPRHQLYQSFRWPIFTTWITTLTVAIILAFSTLNINELINGLILMVLSITITLLIQKRILGPHPHLQKSLLTAFLISGSALLFPLSNTTPQLTHLLSLTLSMLGLFTLNCLLIHTWERDIDRSHNETIPYGQRLPSIIFTLITLLSATTASITFSSSIIYPIVLSLLALASLHRLSQHISLASRRTLADIALLTPLLLLVS